MEPAKKSSDVRRPVAAHDVKKKGGILDDLRQHRSREFVFAVVGYAGSGTSFVASQLAALCKRYSRPVSLIKARTVLEEFAKKTGKQLPAETSTPLEKITILQNIGDALREGDGVKNQHGAVAGYMVRKICELRASTAAGTDTGNIYILDSLKHPAEIHLLRHVYGEHFYLIGVGCRPDIRKIRLAFKLNILKPNESHDLRELIDRDAEDSDKDHGQKVNDTFHLSDYFVDNTANREEEAKFFLPDKLTRLLEILFEGKIHSPLSDERGLYYANAAALRSSCLSRRVGASIMSAGGDLVATGSNDVPKFGGGLYDEDDGNDDDRCFKHRGVCSNTEKQNELVKKIYDSLIGENLLTDKNFEGFKNAIKGTGIRALIEFSRSVHAEMDALISLARSGTKLPSDATLYSTTYPCHNCARHIVAAGIRRVVYLEPYAKSLAIDLHNDSIADNEPPEKSENKVIFEPYQGVSPRLYAKIFSKKAELKDKQTGKMIEAQSLHGEGRGLWTKTYREFEEEVISYIEMEIEHGGKPSAA